MNIFGVSSPYTQRGNALDGTFHSHVRTATPYLNRRQNK